MMVFVNTAPVKLQPLVTTTKATQLAERLVVVVAGAVFVGAGETGFEIGTKKPLSRLVRVCRMTLDIQSPQSTAPNTKAARNTVGQK